MIKSYMEMSDVDTINRGSEVWIDFGSRFPPIKGTYAGHGIGRKASEGGMCYVFTTIGRKYGIANVSPVDLSTDWKPILKEQGQRLERAVVDVEGVKDNPEWVARLKAINEIQALGVEPELQRYIDTILDKVPESITEIRTRHGGQDPQGIDRMLFDTEHLKNAIRRMYDL